MQTEYHMKNLEIKLQELFTVGQIIKLKNGTKRLNWSEEDIARSITLYSVPPLIYYK